MQWTCGLLFFVNEVILTSCPILMCPYNGYCVQQQQAVVEFNLLEWVSLLALLQSAHSPPVAVLSSLCKFALRRITSYGSSTSSFTSRHGEPSENVTSSTD